MNVSAPGHAPTHRRSNLAKLYGAEAVSGAGDGIMWVALVASLAEQPRDGLWIGLAVIARLGPRALLSLPAGAVLDGAALRPVLVGADLGRSVTMGLATGLVLAGAGPGPILAAVLLSYVVAVPTRPGLSALLPRVSGETYLAEANAVLSTTRQVMTFIGPLIGVGIVAWSSVAAYAINALSFALSAVLIASLRGVPWPTRARRRDGRRRRPWWALGSSWGSSLDTVRAVSGLPALVGLVGVMYMVRGAEMVLYVIVVRDVLGEEPASFGYLAGAVGLGAVLATPIARRAGDTARPLRAVVVSVALTAVPTAALGFSRSLLLAAALLVFVGVGMVLFEVVSVVTVQRSVPPDQLGRAFGVVHSSGNAGKLFGAVAAPPLVLFAGPAGALVAIALVTGVLTAAAVPSLRRIGLRTEDRRRGLEPVVDMLARLDLFDGTPRTSIERLAAAVVEEHCAQGQVLIREGDAADDLFVAMAGRFEVTVRGAVVNEMGAGAWFGEIGLVDRVERTATVTATTDATVWRIPGDTFLAVLEESGAPPTALVQGIADRLAAGRSI